MYRYINKNMLANPLVPQLQDGLSWGYGHISMQEWFAPEGEWKEGKICGQDTMTSANGQHYDGEWK
jgi:hypothetical protein